MNFSIGDFQVHHLPCENFRLDGGAMFGVVPKILWERTNPPDELNRIQMTSNCLLITDGKVRIILETGLGSLKNKKFEMMYAIEGKSLDEVLSEKGFSPTEIDLVILSHLHFDHCGGAVRENREGHFSPAFPNAVYCVQKREIEAAMNSNERTKASYVRHTFEPLVVSGLLREFDGEAEVYPGISLIVAEGHSEGMQCTLVKSGDETLFFAADLFPLKEHVHLPVIMSYDLFPLKTLETKRRMLARALKEKWYTVFVHDKNTPFGYIEEKDGKYSVQALREKQAKKGDYGSDPRT